jgi:hypothetical protein
MQCYYIIYGQKKRREKRETALNQCPNHFFRERERERERKRQRQRERERDRERG